MATRATELTDDESAGRLSVLRRLYALVGGLNGERTLAATLQAVVDGVVGGLGFGIAVVNLVQPDGTFETVAVAGSEDARATLLGSRTPADAFDAEFAAAESWGRLRFVSHLRLPAGELTGWIPPEELVVATDSPDAWHPLDALFVPLLSSAGELVGMLSVDLPDDGRRPGPLQRELLEMFATQAGIAVDNANLTESLHAEHALLVREKQRLAASEEAFRLAFEGAGVGMAMVGLHGGDAGRFLRVNQAMCEITGHPAEKLVGMTFTDITHPEDIPGGSEWLVGAVGGRPEVYRSEKRYVRPDGVHVWVALTASVVRLDSGEALYAITQAEDITARRATTDAIARQATQDPLTGLLNRTGLQTDLEHTLRRSHAGGRDGAVLFCDLDGFKAVNDTHGHQVGDEVLTVVARRLTEQVRTGDTVSRLGGDEFVILAKDVTNDELLRLAQRIQRSIAAPMMIAGTAVSMTVSIGIAALNATVVETAAPLREADAAMYRAKAAGRDRYVFADSFALG